MTIRHVVACNVVGLAGSVADHVPPVGRFVRRGLTVFLFHDVTDTPAPYQVETGSSTPTRVFERQVDWIARHFRVIHPASLVDDDPEPGSAVISFDDAWRGVATHAVPILAARGLPCVLFLNMGTVDGTPDLGAVAGYEAAHVAVGERVLPDVVAGGVGTVHRVRDRYGTDPAFLGYQGRVLDAEVLADLPGELVALGSHLYHHWRSSELVDADFELTYRANEAALARHPNAVPLFAFPFGARGRDFRDEQVGHARRLGAARVFTAHGDQNDDPGARELDRLWFTAETESDRACWYRTHGSRLRGLLAGRR